MSKGLGKHERTLLYLIDSQNKGHPKSSILSNFEFIYWGEKAYHGDNPEEYNRRKATMSRAFRSLWKKQLLSMSFTCPPWGDEIIIYSLSEEGRKVLEKLTKGGFGRSSLPTSPNYHLD